MSTATNQTAKSTWGILSDAETHAIEAEKYLMGMGGLLSLLVRSEAANEDWATKARRFLEKCGADGALDLADECPHTFAWDSVPKVQDQRSIDVAAQSLYDDAYREITRLKESISDAHDMARAAR